MIAHGHFLDSLSISAPFIVEISTITPDRSQMFHRPAHLAPLGASNESAFVRPSTADALEEIETLPGLTSPPLSLPPMRSRQHKSPIRPSSRFTRHDDLPTISTADDSPAEGALILNFENATNMHLCILASSFDMSIQCELEGQVKSTQTFENCSAQPIFRLAEVAYVITSVESLRPLTIRLMNSEDESEDMASVQVDVRKWCTPSEIPARHELSTSVSGCKLMLRSSFVPAKMLRLKIPDARRLRIEDGMPVNPYVVAELVSARRPVKQKSAADVRGASRPVWKYSCAFLLFDEQKLKISVYDSDPSSRDELVGDVDVDLANVIRERHREAWIPLNCPSGGEIAGEVHVLASFHEHAIGATPTLDSVKVTPTENMLEQAFLQGQPIMPEQTPTPPTSTQVAAAESPLQAIAPSEAPKPELIDPELDDDEFTEADIRAAFKEIDLDSNAHLSLKEIMHALISAGELVTPEEVDEMISMINIDGRGAVCLEEFYVLAKHPNPLSKRFKPDYLVPLVKENFRKSTKVTSPTLPLLTDAGVVADEPPEMTPEAAAARQATCRRFLLASSLRFSQISLNWIMATAELFFQRANGQLTYVEMIKSLRCKHLPVESRELFENFQFHDHVNFAELLLTLSACSDTDLDSRAKFVFEVATFEFDGKMLAEQACFVGNCYKFGYVHPPTQRKIRTIVGTVKPILIDEYVGLATRFPDSLLG